MSALLQITDMPYRASMSATPDRLPKEFPSGKASLSLAPAPRACAFVFIENLPQLAQAYGSNFAMSVSREIRRRLCARFLTSVKADLACLRDDCFLLWSNDSFTRDDGS